MQLQKYYNLKTAILEAKGKKDIIKGICDNEEVLYQWQILTEDEEDLVVVDELYYCKRKNFRPLLIFVFLSSLGKDEILDF